MADLTPAGAPRQVGDRADRALDRLAAPTVVVIGSVVLLLALGLGRIAAGWWPLAPDDARYLFVGLSVLDGQGPVTPSGATYLLRSPVFGIALALGGRLLGGDPIDGARMVAAGVAMLCLLGALRVAWLTAGSIAVAGTSIALAATPLVWQLLPTLRIDLAQAALIVLLLLVAWRPTIRRWAAAGVVVGLAVLTKEAALPLLLLPLALAGSVPRRAVLAMAAAYAGAAVATAGWWWVVVWMSSGLVFPLNALGVIEARDVAGSVRVTWATGALAAAAILGWLLVVLRARTEFGPRLIVVAALGMTPAALYAASQGLDERNFAALSILSSIAMGIGAAGLLRDIRKRRFRGRSRIRRLAIPAVAIATIVTAVAVGQSSVPRPASDRLADEIVTWVDEHVPEGGRIVMSFRERESVALRRFGRTVVRALPLRRVDVADDPASYVWIGLRDAQLFGYDRHSWLASLTEESPSFMVLVGPHPFTPVELLDTGGSGAPPPGLSPVAMIEVGTDRADILRVDPAEVARGTGAVALHLSADAAVAWLDLAGGPEGDDDAVARLLAARPVVSGSSVPALVERLGDRACAVAGPAGTMVLTLAPTCPA